MLHEIRPQLCEVLINKRPCCLFFACQEPISTVEIHLIVTNDRPTCKKVTINKESHICPCSLSSSSIEFLGRYELQCVTSHSSLRSKQGRIAGLCRMPHDAKVRNDLMLNNKLSNNMRYFKWMLVNRIGNARSTSREQLPRDVKSLAYSAFHRMNKENETKYVKNHSHSRAVFPKPAS
ncbi:putative prefoldin subunit 2 [Fusarium oxysporum f. sp. albedinis]|nr:putative prefoldin subunit 2 [Fusarium oxysporum f. sp. albedinis]